VCVEELRKHSVCVEELRKRSAKLSEVGESRGRTSMPGPSVFETGQLTCRHRRPLSDLS
jgi:hypothetical protein